MPHTNPPKDNLFIQICIAVIGIVLAAAIIGLWNETVSTHDTLIKHGDTLEALVKAMTSVETKLATVPTRTEVDSKIARLRTDVDSDNKLTQKGTKGAELLNQNNQQN